MVWVQVWWGSRVVAFGGSGGSRHGGYGVIMASCLNWEGV